MITVECDSRSAGGLQGAKQAEAELKRILSEKGEANMVLAAAPSQNEILAALAVLIGDWSNISIYHMDEYCDLGPQDPRTFGHYIRAAVSRFKTPPKKLRIITPGFHAHDEIAKLNNEFKNLTIDLLLGGIGENGHLAFNDPPADFNSTTAFKLVTLDQACRQQQVNDGCFSTIDEVPSQAITMTIQQFARAETIILSVYGKRKSAAVKKLESCAEKDPTVPSSYLIDHPKCTLYVDYECYRKPQ